MNNVKENLKLKEMSKRAGKILLMTTILVTASTIPVFAAGPATGADTITNGFVSLNDIVKSFVSSIGTLIVLWGLFEWGNAMQSNDGTMQSMAFKRIGGGIVMTLGPQLLSVFTNQG